MNRELHNMVQQREAPKISQQQKELEYKRKHATMSGLLLSAHSPKPGTCVPQGHPISLPGTTPTGLDKGKSFMRGLGQLFESQGLATGEMVRVAAQREERFRV